MADYPDFIEKCGYGDVQGIGGANCRHSFYAFIEGVMERTYTDEELEAMKPENRPKIEFEGKEYSDYDATQKQRQIERTIRKVKREKAAFEAAGLTDEAAAAGSKLRRLNAEYKAFSKAAGLPEQLERMRVEWPERNRDLQSGLESGTIVQGKNILDSWERNPDEFDFEIEDAMHAQGFDGLPRVVSPEEFDRAVAESKFIAQRTYSAPSQEILEEYRKQLYSGKWYVDCSTGGAQYGQGMYCAADWEGKLTEGIREEMQHYRDLNQQRLKGDEPIPNEVWEKLRATRVTTADKTYYEVLDKFTSGVSEAKGIERDLIKAMADWDRREKLAKEMGLKDNDEIRRFYNKLSMQMNKLRDEIDMRFTTQEQYDKFYDKLNKWREYASNRQSEILQQNLAAFAKDAGVEEYFAPTATETLTLDPSAKAITYDDLHRMHDKFCQENRPEIIFGKRIKAGGFTDEEIDVFHREVLRDATEEQYKRARALQKKIGDDKYDEIYEKGIEEFKAARKKYDEYRNMDLGAYATLLGYDAINAEGHGQSGSYTVILNRTKVIFKG